MLLSKGWLKAELPVIKTMLANALTLEIIRHFSLHIDRKFSYDQTICLMILNKLSDILQNHQQCLMGRWLFVNTVLVFLNTIQHVMRHRLVNIAGTTILVRCHLVNSQQLIWRSRTTHRSNLLVLDLQMNCVSTSKVGHDDNSPNNGFYVDMTCWWMESMLFQGSFWVCTQLMRDSATLNGWAHTQNDPCYLQCMTLNIFKDGHLGYLNFTI